MSEAISKKKAKKGFCFSYTIFFVPNNMYEIIHIIKEAYVNQAPIWNTVEFNIEFLSLKFMFSFILSLFVIKILSLRGKLSLILNVAQVKSDNKYSDSIVKL